MPAKNKERAEILPGHLEPAYLLRLFFAYPPQGFTAYRQQIDKTGQPIALAGARRAAAKGERASAAAAAGNAAAPAEPPAMANAPSAGRRASGKAAAMGESVGIAAAASNAAAMANEQPGGRGGAVSLPLFSCRFNLLTSLEPRQLKRLQKLPFYTHIKKLLTLRTLFLGTTVSEFAPLPPGQAAAAAAYLQAQAKNYPLVIVKDVPQGQNALVAPPQAKAGQNFMAALEKCGFMAVEGQALAYVPVDYADMEAFLARFSKARRKDFRRKLRARQNLTIAVLQQGDAAFADEEQIELYYRLYQQVYAQSLVHFDLLSKDFFRALLQQADKSLRFITYRDKTGQLIGYNICFIVADKLVDKYIGLDYPAATDNSLYFVSWFYNLAYAREQGLKYYVAGWTDPQVKASLGAKFVMTRHAVYIRNPLLRLILRLCRPLFEADAHMSAAPPAAKAAAAPKAARKAGGSR